MSDSNIYMALAQSLLLSVLRASVFGENGRKYEERVEAGGEGQREASAPKNRGWSISDAICPPHYFRIRWSPSPSSSLTVLIKKQLSSGKL